MEQFSDPATDKAFRGFSVVAAALEVCNGDDRRPVLRDAIDDTPQERQLLHLGFRPPRTSVQEFHVVVRSWIYLDFNHVDSASDICSAAYEAWEDFHHY